MSSTPSLSIKDEPKLELPPENQEATPANQSSEAVDAKDPAQSFNPGWRFVLAFVSLCVITLMSALDATSISVALPVSPMPFTTSLDNI